MDDTKSQDQQLFSQIAIDVRQHPNRYSRAGRWLDKYWGGNRQLLRRFGKARQELLDECKEAVSISEDDAVRIILITWLLTDADAQKTNPNITQFATWPWKPSDDIISGSRCAASRLWYNNAHDYDRWMRLARMAWGTLEAQEQTETEQSATAAKDKKADRNTYISGGIQAENVQIGDDASIHKHAKAEKDKGKVWKVLRAIALIVGFFAALLTILHYLGWLEPIKAFIHKIR